jgi:hypothetical protein
VAKLLLKHGANANSCCVNKYTPLHIACYDGHMKCVQALLLCHGGVEVDVKNSDGNTPLDYARRQGHESIVNILEKHMKAQQQRKAVQAEQTVGITNSITLQNISSTPKETDEASSSKEVTTSTTTPHDLELEKKPSKEKNRHGEGHALEKKLQVLEAKYVHQQNQIQELEAQKHSQCATTEVLVSNLEKIQEMLEKQFKTQQALVKENTASLEQKINSTTQEKLKMQASESQTYLQGANEVHTDTLKKIQEMLEKQFKTQQALVKENIAVLEQKIDLRDQEFKTFSQQQYERCSTSSKRKMANDDDIDEGPNSKRMKVTHDVNEGTKMMKLEKGVVTIQQSMERMERKSFRKDIILIGLGGALKFIFGSSR